MSETVIWFIIFCVILGSEMMFSTIYLLAFAAGALSAALLSLITSSFTAQVTLCAIVTAAGALIVFFIRRRRKNTALDNDVQNPDAGREISVGKVVNGVSRVSYRGTTWDAVSETDPLEVGIWEIDRIDGTRLIVKKPHQN